MATAHASAMRAGVGVKEMFMIFYRFSHWTKVQPGVVFLAIAFAVASTVPWSRSAAEATDGATVSRDSPLGNEANSATADGQPAGEMSQARASLARGDQAGAAGHLRRAAVLMRAEAEGAFGHPRSALLEAAQDLDHEAALVASGLVVSIDELDVVLGRSGNALAQYRRMQAVESWLGVVRTDIAHELRTTAELVGRAVAWGDRMLDELARLFPRRL
jgi:hypothetical protein